MSSRKRGTSSSFSRRSTRRRARDTPDFNPEDFYPLLHLHLTKHKIFLMMKMIHNFTY